MKIGVLGIGITKFKESLVKARESSISWQNFVLQGSAKQCFATVALLNKTEVCL
jgi:hypothetical protein